MLLFIGLGIVTRWSTTKYYTIHSTTQRLETQ